MQPQKVRLDGVDWYIDAHSIANVVPLCPKHHLSLDFISYDTNFLRCEDCDSPYRLPRSIGKEKKYILKKLDAPTFKSMKLLNLDDEAIPLAEKKMKSKDGKYFVTGLLTESKVGLRLIVYAGEKGSSKKTQIFVEPKIKRLAFDQNDLHPTDVFTVVEATFKNLGKASFKDGLTE